jgi:hypothetical protein
MKIDKDVMKGLGNIKSVITKPLVAEGLPLM